jgi:hypothetical protein
LVFFFELFFPPSPPSQPYLKQAELDKAEYDTLRKEYEDDAAARARGDDVPERKHVDPSYAKETVSPRLLAAVLPGHLLDDDLAVQDRGNGGGGGGGDDVDVDLATSGIAQDDTLTAELLEQIKEHEQHADQSIEQDHEDESHEVKDESGQLLQSLVLPEGIADFAANFDLGSVSGHHEGGNDNAFDYQHDATADEEMGGVNGHVEEAKAGDDDAVVGDASSALDAVVAAVASAGQSVVQSPSQSESLQRRVSVTGDGEQVLPVDNTPAVEESTNALEETADDESAAIENPTSEEQRSLTPEPEQGKIDAAVKMGVTTEGELAETAKIEQDDSSASPVQEEDEDEEEEEDVTAAAAAS